MARADNDDILEGIVPDDVRVVLFRDGGDLEDARRAGLIVGGRVTAEAWRLVHEEARRRCMKGSGGVDVSLTR